MSSTRLIQAITSAIVLLAFAGCSKGYQREYGKWAYVWFDGDGRQVRYLDDAKGKLTILSQREYAKTADHVYLWGIKLPGADPDTFEVVDDAYSKDAKRVYCGSIPMAGANPARFRVLGGIKEPHFYSSAQGIEDVVSPKVAATIDSEVCLAQGWSTDGKTCYFAPNPLDRARPESFKVLDNWYATDGVKVFCGHYTVEEADAETFRVVRGLEAEDKNHVYFQGKVKHKK